MENKQEEFDLPMLTKAGIVAIPSLPILGIDAIAQGGPTPIALSVFALALLASKSPGIVRKAGENERFLLALERSPIWLERLDTMTRGYFSKRIAFLKKGVPVAKNHEVLAREVLPEMEALQPKPNMSGAIFPRYEEDKTLKLGGVLATGQRFEPHINAILGKGAIIAGGQDAGKSNLTGLIAACAGKCYMSLVVFDLKGEFYTLTEVVPNGVRAGHPSFAEEAGDGYYSLTVENAREFAEIIMVYGFQAIIDIPSYNGNNDEIAEVMAVLLNGLMDWSQQQAEQDRLPCLVITDEAHNFLPESRNLSAMRMTKDNYDLLQSAYSRMANTGRSYGYTLVMATQRIANIAKWSIANLRIKVIMAHAEKNDLDRCEEEVGKDVANRETVKTLEQGCGIVVGFTKEPYIVKFDKQPARHVSHTPMIERSHQRHKHTEAPCLSRVLATRTPGTNRSERVRYVKDDDYEFFQTRQRRASEYAPSSDERSTEPRIPAAQPEARSANAYGLRPASLPAERTGHFTARIPADLQNYYELYEPGIGLRDLGNLWHVNKDTAGKIKRRLLDYKLISPDGAKLV